MLILLDLANLYDMYEKLSSIVLFFMYIISPLEPECCSVYISVPCEEPFLCFFDYNIVFLEPGCGAVCAGVWGPALRRCQTAPAPSSGQ